MKTHVKTLAKFMAFLLVFTTFASSPEFVRAAVRTLANWGSINTATFDVSQDIYLQRVFNTGEGTHVGVAVDPVSHLSYFVTSSDLVNWDIEAEFFSLVQAHGRFYGVNFSGLFYTDLNHQWQRANLPDSVRPANVRIVDNTLRLVYSTATDSGVMFSQDGNTWFSYTNHLAPNSQWHDMIVLSDSQLLTFASGDGYFRAFTSPAFTENTAWEEVPGARVEGNFSIAATFFNGTSVAVSLYAMMPPGMNWSQWETDNPFPDGLVLASTDMVNWQETHWGGIMPDWVTPTDMPVPGLTWSGNIRIPNDPISWTMDVSDQLVTEVDIRLVAEGNNIHHYTYISISGGAPTLTRILLNGTQVSRGQVGEVPVQTPPEEDTPPGPPEPPAPYEPTAQWPASITAVPSANNVLVNGEAVSFVAYNIQGNNFFRLRDIAYALNGTSSQFEVGWDAANSVISLTTGTPYTPIGGEMEGSTDGSVTATFSTAGKMIDGVAVVPTAYTIGGYNFFMLRDLGEVLGFVVGWDADTSTVMIESN